MLVHPIATVPIYLMRAALTEITKIHWSDSQQDLVRKNSKIFSSSSSLALRIHDAPEGTWTVEQYGEFVKCRDTALRAQFPCMNLLVLWIIKILHGKHLGRIQLVRLEGKGDVQLHIDPGTYFQVHRRYHVPLITNDKTIFFSTHEEARMEVGVLCELNNRELHGVRNESDNPRVHLIVDLQTEDYSWK